MTAINYLGGEIKIPDNWGDIKLRDYEGFYLDRPETMRDKVALVAKICKVDIDLILRWPAEIFNLLVDKTYFIFEESPVEPSASITIGETAYVIAVEEKLTLGAYIDADQTQKEETNVLSNILAIVCRPAGEEYDPDKNEERAEMFGALTVAEIQPLLGFFLHCKTELDKRTIAFTRLHQVAELLPPSTEVLRNLGAGIKLSTIWHTVKYGITIMLLRYRLRKLSRMYSTKEIRITQKLHKGN